MSKFPKLPDCAPWCHAPHYESGEKCRRNIDEIAGPAGRDDVEVNVIRVDGVDMMQLLVLDKSLINTYPQFAHHEIRLDTMGGGVLGDMLYRGLDRRGLQQLGAALVEAFDLVHEHSCGRDWCRVDHSVSTSVPGEHHGDPVTVGGVEVTTYEVEKLGKQLSESFVRLRYQVAGHERVEDVSPQEVVDRAEFFGALELGEIDHLMEAFRAAAAELGVTQ